MTRAPGRMSRTTDAPPARAEPVHAPPEPAAPVHGRAVDRDRATPPPPAQPRFDFAALAIHREPSHEAGVQLRACRGRTAAGPVRGTAAREAALAGLGAGGGPLPHLARLQRAFGPEHDLSRVIAHVGGPAAEASERLGADGYAVREHVAFRAPPDLHLAAHEAAHVVQQRSGVQLRDHVGRTGDRYEQQADAVADAVVGGRSAAALLSPATTATPSAAVQLDDRSAEAARLAWERTLDTYTAASEALPPGPDRARARRVVLLFQSGPETAFDNEAAVNRFAARCEATANDEAGTLDALARLPGMLGASSAREDLLAEDSAAFPASWADRLAALRSGVDENALGRVLDIARAGALELARQLNDDIWTRGLPLSRVQAMQLTLGRLVPAVLTLPIAEGGSDEVTARYARALLRWERASAHAALVRGYEWSLGNTIERVRKGEEVGASQYDALKFAHWIFQAKERAYEEAAASPADIRKLVQVLELFDGDKFRRGAGDLGMFQFHWQDEAIEAFGAELARVDARIAGAPSAERIWRAGVWAGRRGYFSDEAIDAWEALKHDWYKGIPTLVGIALLQAIPGVDVAVDVVLIMEFRLDILLTVHDLGDALLAAGQARTTVELEHASVRLASTLVGDAVKLVKWAATWSAAKAVGKIKRWRAGKKFIDANSSTPEAAAEARKALSDARGDVGKAENILQRRRAEREQARKRDQEAAGKRDAAAKPDPAARDREQATRRDEAARKQREEAERKQREDDAARARKPQTGPHVLVDTAQVAADAWVEHLKSQLDPAARGRFEQFATGKSSRQIVDHFAGDIARAATELGNTPPVTLPDTAERFTVGKLPKPGRARWKYLEDPAHWTPERAALHDRLIAKAKMQIQQIAEQLAGREPTLYAMRGNTAAGKTRAVSGNVAELAGLMQANAGLRHRTVNPDNFKMDLIEATPGATSTDVHAESSMLAFRLEDELQGLRTSDGKPATILIDRRLPTVDDVGKYAKIAKETGRRFVLFDVDAPLVDSLVGVLERQPGRSDPLPPFSVVAQGFEAIRANRRAVVDYFSRTKTGTYRLYGTRPDGARVEIANIINGEPRTLDEPGLRHALAPANLSLKTDRITPEAIEAITRSLAPDRASHLRAILHRYEGWTWESALDAHSMEKPST